MHPNLQRMRDGFHACDRNGTGAVSDADFLDLVERTSGRVPAVETLLAQFQSREHGAGWVDYGAFIAHLAELLGEEPAKAPPTSSPAPQRTQTTRQPPRPLPVVARQSSSSPSSGATHYKSVAAPPAPQEDGGGSTSRRLFAPAGAGAGANFEEVDIELTASQTQGPGQGHSPPAPSAQRIHDQILRQHRCHGGGGGGTPPRYPPPGTSPARAPSPPPHAPAAAGVGMSPGAYSHSPHQEVRGSPSPGHVGSEGPQATSHLLEPPDDDDERPAVLAMDKIIAAPRTGSGRSPAASQQQQQHPAVAHAAAPATPPAAAPRRDDQQVRALFEQLDTDCCGVVTYDRLLAYFNSKGRVDEAIYERVFDMVDTKATGFLDYAQFGEFMAMVKPPPGERGSDARTARGGHSPRATSTSTTTTTASAPAATPVEDPRAGAAGPMPVSSGAGCGAAAGAPVRAISDVLSELAGHAGMILQQCNQRDAARRGFIALDDLFALLDASLPPSLLPITRHHIAELVEDPAARGAVLNDPHPTVDYIDLVSNLMGPAPGAGWAGASATPRLRRRTSRSPHAAADAPPAGSPSAPYTYSASPVGCVYEPPVAAAHAGDSDALNGAAEEDEAPAHPRPESAAPGYYPQAADAWGSAASPSPPPAHARSRARDQSSAASWGAALGGGRGTRETREDSFTAAEQRAERGDMRAHGRGHAHDDYRHARHEPQGRTATHSHARAHTPRGAAGASPSPVRRSGSTSRRPSAARSTSPATHLAHTSPALSAGGSSAASPHGHGAPPKGEMAQARRRRTNRTVHLALVRLLGTKHDAARRISAGIAAAAKKTAKPAPARGDVPPGYMKAQDFSRVIAALYRAQGEEPVRNVVAACVEIGKRPFADLACPTPFEAAACAAAGALPIQHVMATQLVDHRFFLAEVNLAAAGGAGARKAASPTQQQQPQRTRAPGPVAPPAADARYEHTHDRARSPSPSPPQAYLSGGGVELHASPDAYHAYLVSQLRAAGQPPPGARRGMVPVP